MSDLVRGPRRTAVRSELARTLRDVLLAGQRLVALDPNLGAEIVALLVCNWFDGDEVRALNEALIRAGWPFPLLGRLWLFEAG